ncbi:MAG: hypothetical protein GX663_10405 [Clostridiales bacterium]|nr:hypothetical protein [Clostridiales bacterium]
MDHYRKQLEEIRFSLESLKEKLMVEQNECPLGRLNSSIDRGRLQYYAVKEVDRGQRKSDGRQKGTNNRQKKVGINNNPEIIKGLARKEFLIRTCKELNNNIMVVQRAIDNFRTFEPKGIIGVMTKAYRSLPEDYFFKKNGMRDEFLLNHDERIVAGIKSHEAWARQPYEQSDYRSEERNKITSQGERMRSKSEVMIAEKLYEYGVPFRYEQVINVGKWKLAPDFTFEDRKKDEFYWEYCGLMDNIQYVN